LLDDEKPLDDLALLERISDSTDSSERLFGGCGAVPLSVASPRDVLACALRLPVELPSLRPVLDAAAIIVLTAPTPIRGFPYPVMLATHERT
jgi:hypothetical protein